MEHNEFRPKRKRFKNINFIVFICIVSVVSILAGIWTTKQQYSSEHDSVQTANITQSVPEETKEITLLMVGDNLLHTPLIANAKSDDGSYNFDNLYEELADEFKSSDISVIVQETVLSGADLKYSGYPLFNSPQEVGDSLVRAGFDIILSATNHALDKGEEGVMNTLEFWKKYPQITVLGMHDSQESYQTVKYVEKNGIKIAVLNYTDSTNGIPLPKTKEYLVNVVDKAKIEEDLKVAEENADFTVVFMHWGTEYRLSSDQGQQDLAKFMTERGADLIMGSHPHVVEPAEWIETENGNKALVFYSLGNYVSRQKEANNLLGAMGKVKVCSSEEKGTYIENASVTPLVTHYNVNSRGFRVYRLSDYTDELAAKHGVAQYDGAVSVERFRSVFDSVFAQCTAVTIED